MYNKTLIIMNARNLDLGFDTIWPVCIASLPNEGYLPLSKPKTVVLEGLYPSELEEVKAIISATEANIEVLIKRIEVKHAEQLHFDYESRLVESAKQSLDSLREKLNSILKEEEEEAEAVEAVQEYYCVNTKFHLAGSELDKAVRKELNISDNYIATRPDTDTIAVIGMRMQMPDDAVVKVTWEEVKVTSCNVDIGITDVSGNLLDVESLSLPDELEEVVAEWFLKSRKTQIVNREATIPFWFLKQIDVMNLKHPPVVFSKSCVNVSLNGRSL